MRKLAANILASAAMSLFEEQPTLSKFTSETNEYEPNLSFHYANMLRRFLFWLDCDFDVIKPNLGHKRPDIIFHKRGIHTLNFLAVEVKRSEDDAEADLKKIKREWFNRRLSYRFGASVVLNPNRRFCVQLLQRETGKRETRRSEEEFNRIGFLEIPDRQVPLMKLVDGILAAKHPDAEADACALEREIDQLVYALYGLTPEEIQIVEGSTIKSK